MLAYEIRNGGISVTLGTYTLRRIKSFESSFEPEYDSQNSFTNFDGTVHDAFIGSRYNVNIKAGPFEVSEVSGLMNALKSHTFTMESTDFSGKVRVTKCSQPYHSANFMGKYVFVDFSLAAVGLLDGGSL